VLLFFVLLSMKYRNYVSDSKGRLEMLHEKRTWWERKKSSCILCIHTGFFDTDKLFKT